MIKLLKTKTYNQFKERITQLEKELEEEKQSHTALSDAYENQSVDLKLIKEQYDSLLNKLNDSDENSVKFVISKDLTQVTPVVRVNTESHEKMIEMGYIKDGDENHKFATQLALITIVDEAVDQIIESFSAPIEK